LAVELTIKLLDVTSLTVAVTLGKTYASVTMLFTSFTRENRPNVSIVFTWKL